MRLPTSVRAYLRSSRSALEDSAALPGAFKHNATRYRLLIDAWELLELADAELKQVIGSQPVAAKVYKDHAAKLHKAPDITHIVIVGGKPYITKYTTAKAKAKLRETLTYGKNDTSRDKLFERGWHFDAFARRVNSRLSLTEITVQAIEEL